jgi:uncharacterized repeat protein (TIGR02543 family)
VRAFDFVITAKEVTGSDDEILKHSHADVVHVDAKGTVSHLKAVVKDNAGYEAVAGDYKPVKIGAGAQEAPIREITAKVISRDALDEGSDTGHPGDQAYYAVAANNVILNLKDAPDYVGDDAIVKARLIKAAQAVGYKMLNGTEDWDVDVSANGIVNPQAGKDYPVTFIPRGVAGVAVSVTFHVNEGQAPVFVTTKPLVLPQSPASHLLSSDEMKAKMTVSDLEDGVITDKVVATPVGNGTIDQHNVGVYQVEYTVTDSTGNVAKDSRAIVVDDGRYLVSETDDIIIGARNFVVKRSECQGTEAQVRSLSYAEAFDLNGKALPDLSCAPLPDGYVANAETGSYPFVWSVPGHTTTKAITGFVTDASVIDSGTKDSQYALVASDFKVNTVEAAKLVSDASFIAAAKAQVIKLVSSAVDRAVRLVDKGGFVPEQAVYPIRFAIESLDVNDYKAVINATVTNGSAPVISLVSPTEVALGDTSFDLMSNVAATDAEDGDITDRITVETAPGSAEFDVTTTGIYRLIYAVTDKDFNKVSAERIIVVNDGRYTVSPNNDGRILYATSFVTKVADVASRPSQIPQELLTKSAAALFDGVTGKFIDALSVSSTGGYRKAVGEYSVDIAGADTPRGTLTKPIKARVTDADVLEVGQGDDDPADDPNTPLDPNKDSTYLFGNNIKLLPSAALALLTSDGSVNNEAVLGALSAAGYKATANGLLESVKVKLVEWLDGKTLAHKKLSDVPGLYKVLVADENDQVDIVLSLNVVIGSAPSIDAPKPVVIPASDSSTPLNRDDLMKGADPSGKPWAVAATDDEDGDLTDRVEIRDPKGEFPAIAPNKPGVYPVTYEVTDNDGNKSEVSSAVVVDDGSFIIDANYILTARSFLIGKSAVTPAAASTQILERSGAAAYRTDGTPATAVVLESAGYTAAVGEYQPKIGISGYPTMSRIITATVFDDSKGPGGEAGVNGEKYAIRAHGFRLNIAEAEALAALQGSAVYDATFLSRSGAKSYLRTSSNLVLGGHPQLANDGGFDKGTPFKEGDTFPVTFQVSEEPDTMVTVEVLVSNASAPVLNVPAWREVPQYSSFGDAEYTKDVTYYDNEDAEGDLTFTYDKPVDTAKAGVYEVTYQVTDSDHNTTTKVGRVLVNDGNWTLGKSFLIYAHDFIKDFADVSGLPDEILKLSEAKALRADDLMEVPAVVVHDGGYQKSPGQYPRIQLAPKPEQTTVRTITATITGGTWKVGFDPNGGRLTGPAYLSVTGRDAHLPFMPQDPTRDGYRFVSWNTARDGSGSYFSAQTPINGDMTLYAQWRALPTPPPPPAPPAPPAPPVVNVYPAGGSPTYVSLTTPPAETVDQNTVTDPSSSSTTGGGAVTPVTPISVPAAAPQPSKSWSLIDLIFTILGVLLLMCYTTKFFFDRRDEQEKLREAQEAQAASEEAQAAEAPNKVPGAPVAPSRVPGAPGVPGTPGAPSWMEPARQKLMQMTLPALLVSAAAVIESIAVLLLTQDFTSQMVLFDECTILFTLLLFVMLICPLVAAIRHSQREQELYRRLLYQQQLAQWEAQRQYRGPTF